MFGKEKAMALNVRAPPSEALIFFPEISVVWRHLKGCLYMEKICCFFSTMLMLGTMMSGIAGCDGDGGSGIFQPQQRLRIATTTSLYDTGLWNVLEERFEEEHDIRLDIINAGTGISFEYGRRGDVDAVVVHARYLEEEFIKGGYGVERVPFAYNYFVIVGPEDDPVGIKGMSPEDAVRKLHDDKDARFISRGDESGTHVKEKDIWQFAGIDYQQVRNSGNWYIEAGRGMGPTLLMAKEQQGYTLSDLGTFLAFKSETGLEPVVDEGAILLNVYSMIILNPDIISDTRFERARLLEDFLASDEIQELIGEYGVKDYGEPLFMPCAGNEPDS